MKKEPIFIDTGFWIAYVNTKDKNHPLVQSKFKDIAHDFSLYTSESIVFETLTFFNCSMKRHDIASSFYHKMKAIGQNVLCYNDVDKIYSLKLFFDYSDIRLSMTDCLSFAMMKRYGISTFLGFDNHFRVMGFKDALGAFA